MKSHFFCSLHLNKGKRNPISLHFRPHFLFEEGKEDRKSERRFLFPSFSFYLQFFSSILFVLPFFRNDKKKEAWKLSTPIFFHTYIRREFGFGDVEVGEMILFNFHLCFLFSISFSLFSFYKKKWKGKRKRKFKERKWERWNTKFFCRR